MDYYFARGRVNSDTERESVLFVNNCGYYKGLDERLEIRRPMGRQDFHLLFCVNGAIEVEEERLTGGDLFLFYPRERQNYTYLPTADSVYYWVHFTGTEVFSLLERAGIRSGKHVCQSRLSDLESLFSMLAAGLGEKNPATEPLAAGLMCAILMLLPNAKMPTSPFAGAVRRLEDFSAEVSIGELADMYKMSNGHFIRSFRSYFGVSPYQYRRKKQIQFAKMLLANSSLSVARVAARAGFEDPLYFSRLFRKYVGKSPLQYRRSP